MQKQILIISYFFHPCSLTAGQRALGWANYLSENGYYPTVITRRWDHSISTSEDAFTSTGTEIIHEKNERYECYYLPYKATLRDRFYTRFSNSPLQKLSRIFTFLHLVFENFTLTALPYRNLYPFSKDWLRKNPEVNYVIISGAPFHQFAFGYRLKKKLGIKWIADYRDDWSSPDIVGTSGNGILGRFVNKLNARSEKKWVGTAECITSVSDHYAQKIGQFVNRPSHVILNGFELDIPKGKIDPKHFVITYNGSLYHTQPVEEILEVIKRLILEDHLPIKFQFPGAAFDPAQQKRIEDSAEEILDSISITDRIPKKEVLQLQANSDALLMISHSNLKGIPSSKLYEYLPFEKPVIQYPNDHDIIEETLNDYGMGFSASNTDELYETLKRLAQAKLSGRTIEREPNKERIEFYSRKNQTKVLSELLDQLHSQL